MIILCSKIKVLKVNWWFVRCISKGYCSEHLNIYLMVPGWKEIWNISGNHVLAYLHLVSLSIGFIAYYHSWVRVGELTLVETSSSVGYGEFMCLWKVLWLTWVERIHF